MRPGAAARWQPWLLAGYAVASVVAGMVLTATAGRPSHPMPPWPLEVLPLAAITATACLLLARLPGHGITRVLTVLAVAGLSGSWLGGLAEHSTGVALAVVQRLINVAWGLTIPVLALLILLFPTGRAPGPRWVPVLRIQFAALGVGLVCALVGTQFPVQVVAALAGVVLVATSGAAAVSLLVRWRRADRREQAGMRAFAVVAVGLVGWYVVGTVLSFTFGASSVGDIVLVVLTTGLPVAVGYGVLRHRLYDIDVVVRRVVVWSVLSAVLLAGYLAVAAVVSAAAGDGRAGPVVAAAAVVLVLAPLSRLAQRAVDRLLYGRRGDPAQVLQVAGRALATTGASHEVPQRLAELTAATLRLPWVCVELDREGQWEPMAAAGARDPAGAPTVTIGLAVAGEEPARLVVQPRRGEPALTGSDRRLLDDLAMQVAPTLLSVRLIDELERSRERLLAARRDERERLRRDVHDTLSPALNGIRLAVTAGRRLLHEDPVRAAELLTIVSEEIEQTVESARRIQDRLRPTGLDDGDAVSAVADRTQQIGLAGGLAVTIRADAPLPRLPRAVSEAVYRIAVEAVTNAARHASAGHCTVRIVAQDGITVEVCDDGHGLPRQVRPGVGWESMIARAAAAGGRCEVMTRAGGGTRVVAVLPLVGVT